MKENKFLWLLSIPILFFAIVFSYYRIPSINDLINRFPKEEKNAVRVLIGDFYDKSEGEVGKEFTKRLYEQLIFTTTSPETIAIADTNLVFKINFRRTNQYWNKNKMKKRGGRRRADLGVVGSFTPFYETGALVEKVERFQAVLIDTSLYKVFECKEPISDIYNFSVRDPKMYYSVLAEKVSDPIKYIIYVAVDFALSREAVRLKEKGDTLRALNITLA